MRGPIARQVEAVGLVLALPPAGADPELDPAAGDVVGGDDHLRQHRRVAEGRRRDQRPQPQLHGRRRQRRDRRPGVERAALAPVVDREVVVGAEQRPDPVRSQAAASASQSSQVTSSWPSIIKQTSKAAPLARVRPEITQRYSPALNSQIAIPSITIPSAKT